MNKIVIDAEIIDWFKKGNTYTFNGCIYELIERARAANANNVRMYVLHEFVVVLDDGSGLTEDEIAVIMTKCGRRRRRHQCTPSVLGCAVTLSQLCERESDSLTVHISSVGDNGMSCGFVSPSGLEAFVSSADAQQEEFHKIIRDAIREKDAPRLAEVDPTKHDWKETGTLIVIPRSQQVTFPSVQNLMRMQDQIVCDIAESRYDRKYVDDNLNRMRLNIRYLGGFQRFSFSINNGQAYLHHFWVEEHARFAVYVHLDQPEGGKSSDFVRFRYLGSNPRFIAIFGTGPFAVKRRYSSKDFVRSPVCPEQDHLDEQQFRYVGDVLCFLMPCDFVQRSEAKRKQLCLKLLTCCWVNDSILESLNEKRLKAPYYEQLIVKNCSMDGVLKCKSQQGRVDCVRLNDGIAILRRFLFRDVWELYED